MVTLLKHARIAWNPIGEVRTKLADGTLTVSSVIVPFLAVIVGCNLLAVGAQQFFLESLEYATGVDIPTDHPLINNKFALQFLSSIGVLIPTFIISLLPQGVFYPAGKSTTVASIFIIMAAWAFYGAALGVPHYFISGVLVLSDPKSGIELFTLLSIPVSLTVVGLTIWFWFRILHSKLQLSAGSITLITTSYIVSLAILVILLIPIFEQ